MDKNSKIYIAGAAGLVGRAIKENLLKKGYKNLITPSSAKYDLRYNDEVRELFFKYQPEYVILAAAKVGGIQANNTQPARFIVDNILIQTNVITECYKAGVKKLLFLGSSCIYPKLAPQPIKEEYLMTGSLEPTNSPYAIAKICGIEMTRAYNKQFGTNYICVMPTNLFSEHDNFDPETSHVLPGMIHKFTEAVIEGKEEVILWGDGSPRRELLYSEDIADACIFLMKNYNVEDPYDNIVNVGYGTDITIKELAEFIQKISGFKGKVIWDKSKPNGTLRKLLDCSKIKKLGWVPKYDLFKKIENVYNNYEIMYELNHDKM
jgi:GDP-L-fucose synthase